jgi:hypothetical protein
LEISPEIWSILIKQVYFEAMAKFLWGTAIVLSGYISYKKINFDEDGRWIKTCIIGIFGMVGFALFLSALMWMLHPEFYALRFILQQIN